VVLAVLGAATVGAAAALRRADIGHLGVGAAGDLVVIDGEHETDLIAHLGSNGIIRTVVAGAPSG
jgi:imidazolonepropionase